ncbi:hypothetical protein EJ03DRAFT_17817 [Teratosphaeria nubilosa]|uniref:Uncharacterized protein n=1 Tax=Teratosphaeria nubilosa TaxID=161662 RepID=A0A6G1KVL3_9PEZI|nr:hypothetical protein EJ03DRAFT_17817 [Teratosphaeria nubilosa]
MVVVGCRRGPGSAPLRTVIARGPSFPDVTGVCPEVSCSQLAPQPRRRASSGRGWLRCCGFLIIPRSRRAVMLLLLSLLLTLVFWLDDNQGGQSAVGACSVEHAVNWRWMNRIRRYWHALSRQIRTR